MKNGNTTEGVIMKGVGGLYTVRPDFAGYGEEGYISCSARGKLRLEDVTPYPGDRVELEREGEAWAIVSVLERKNSLRRPTVANVSHLAAVIPRGAPEARPGNGGQADMLCGKRGNRADHRGEQGGYRSPMRRSASPESTGRRALRYSPCRRRPATGQRSWAIIWGDWRRARRWCSPARPARGKAR